jgi:hypothetical protein
MLYLGARFGDPLAFARTQSHWGRTYPFPEKVVALLTYQPIWEGCQAALAGWGSDDLSPHWPFFSLPAINSPYFVLTVILVTFGACKRWLSSYETVLSAALLLIPYVTRSQEMGMASQARFAAAVFPVYLVLGRLLACMPASVAGSLLGVSAFYLGAFSALFATWHMVY